MANFKVYGRGGVLYYVQGKAPRVPVKGDFIIVENPRREFEVLKVLISPLNGDVEVHING